MSQNYDYSRKLFIVGDTEVGKTCLLYRFAFDNYTEDKIHKFYDSNARIFKLDGITIKLKMKVSKNRADIERYRFIKKGDRITTGFFVVYDCTNFQSFENAKQWLEDIDRYVGKDVIELLVGCKCDCVTRKVVDYETAKEYADRMKISFLETSAKTSMNVVKAFTIMTDEMKKRVIPPLLPIHTERRTLAALKDLDEEVVLDNYENKFLHQMNEMRKQNSFCDVKLSINGREFPCHKMMLVNSTLDSGYFKTLFNSGFSESSSEIVQLHNVEPEAIEEILTAIYTTRFHLNRSNAYFILQASHMFLLMDIFNVAVSRIMENPGIDYLMETCLFAQTVGRDDLHQRCISAIAADLKNVVSKTDSFNDKITLELFKMILKDENLIDDQEALFQIISQWSTHNKITEEEVLLLLNTGNVRCGFLNTQMLAKLIINVHSTTSNEIPISNEAK